jgi:hypothetical protein
VASGDCWVEPPPPPATTKKEAPYIFTPPRPKPPLDPAPNVPINWHLSYPPIMQTAFVILKL